MEQILGKKHRMPGANAVVVREHTHGNEIDTAVPSKRKKQASIRKLRANTSERFPAGKKLSLANFVHLKQRHFGCQFCYTD